MASASYLAGPKRPKGKGSKSLERAEAWQDAAWTFYDTVSELRFAANWVGNLLSKAELYVAIDGVRQESGPAVEALAKFYGGPDGQVEMLRQSGIHFTVAGELYIVAEDGGGKVDDRWYVAPAVEFRKNGENRYSWGKKKFEDPLVIRSWKPHPRLYKQPDCPTRAVLPLLSELDGLTKQIAAQIDSRLAGAGILAIPSEMSFAGGPVKTEGGQVISPSAEQFMAMLMDAMMTPLSNREAASALVPLLLQAPGEFLDKIKHITTATPLEERAIQLREEAIKRIAIGMDMPPEALTGMGDMNHWGAWQADESAIKIHSEPLLRVLTGNVTTGYLRPTIEGEVDPDELYKTEVLADTTKLRVRPNRSKEAIELYDRQELSATAMLRENGFETDDAMPEDERKQFFIRKLAGGTSTPEAVVAAFQLLGIELPEIAPADDTNPERPTRSLDEHPVRELPESGEDVGLAASVAAAEVIVYRALERAGNRMKTRHGVLPAGVAAADLYLHREPPTPAEMDILLTDAWSFVQRFDYGVPHEEFVGALDAYTRAVLGRRVAHSRANLRTYVAKLRQTRSRRSLEELAHTGTEG